VCFTYDTQFTYEFYWILKRFCESIDYASIGIIVIPTTLKTTIQIQPLPKVTTITTSLSHMQQVKQQPDRKKQQLNRKHLCMNTTKSTTENRTSS
jgi:hypothetical protein